jgi:ribosomal protein S1
MRWQDEVKKVFPNWQTEKGINEFNVIKKRLKIDQVINGKVIARSRFGVWIDFGVGYPALLLVVNFQNRDARAEDYSGYPLIGEMIEARIITLGPRAEIGLTQLF